MTTCDQFMILSGFDTPIRFSVISAMGDNFVSSCLFPSTPRPFWKRVYSKRKDFFLPNEANSFLLQYTPFQKRVTKYFETISTAPLVEAVLTSTHNICFQQKYEKYQNFLSENFHFLMVKSSIYLNRHVFVMYVFKFSAQFIKNIKFYHSLV